MEKNFIRSGDLARKLVEVSVMFLLGNRDHQANPHVQQQGFVLFEHKQYVARERVDLLDD